MMRGWMGLSLLAALVLAMAGCHSPPPPRTQVFGAAEAGAPFQALSPTNGVDQYFTAEITAPSKDYATKEQAKKFSTETKTEYHLGPGDRFSFIVRGRPDITLLSVTVSPNGEVGLPLVGILNVSGRTLRDVTDQARSVLQKYYENPDVTLVMQEFKNNKVYVLGRVVHPGAVHFDGPGTLLEALSLAGGLPADTQKSFLSRCMVLRGDEMVLWIDLDALLEKGNLALNIRLQNGDFIYIPQSDDQVAYVMGEVNVPGVLLLRSQMTLLDAVMNSGGMTKNANSQHIFLVRSDGERGVVQDVSFDEIMQHGDFRRNYVLRDGDIVYVSEKGISRFNYYMTQLLPTMKVIDFTLSAAEQFGLMQQLRIKLWGQEGFVNGTSQ